VASTGQADGSKHARAGVCSAGPEKAGAASVAAGQRRWAMLGGYRVEIEDSGSEHVVLSIPALRLIVIGRTLGEAEELARAAIAFRRQDDGRCACLASTLPDSRLGFGLRSRAPC
ncbi:MAG: hypothetical protein J2P50_20350, partial [Hyphomicrobiaceae bacterium]|nr:hypothetical protein [Hyphomicrobiaceae bacterium]